MPVRTSDATWNGTLTAGNGKVSLGSGAWEGQYNFSSRFENGTGTNPEELIAAAHAGCYSMALSAGLGAAGYDPQSVSTSANVHVVKDGEGFTINQIDLRTEAQVSGLDDSEFQRIAEDTKQNCPVSKVLTGATINLEAKLR